VRRVYFLAAALFFASFILLTTSPRESSAQNSVAPKTVAYGALEQDVLKEINLARTRPAEYAAYLEQLRPYFVGKELREPGKPALVTAEGVAALDEAIRFLRSAKPVPAFTMSAGMCYGARELVKDQGATGATGHKGADGSFCEQRAKRFGTWTDPIGEDIAYGNDTPRDRVIAWLIDDGVANRGHRARLFNTSYKVVGVACGDHKMGGMCVITFAAGFADKLDAAQPKPGNKAVAPASAKRL
jgi:uncharacterized protein YkwD